MLHYIEPHHKKHFIANMWDFGVAIKGQRMLNITYQRQAGKIVERIIEPVGIMFSEFYFYLTAFIQRLSRILIRKTYFSFLIMCSHNIQNRSYC